MFLTDLQKIILAKKGFSLEKGEEIEIRSKNKKNPYVSQHNSKGIGTQVRIWGK